MKSHSHKHNKKRLQITDASVILKLNLLIWQWSTVRSLNVRQFVRHCQTALLLKKYKILRILRIYIIIKCIVVSWNDKQISAKNSEASWAKERNFDVSELATLRRRCSVASVTGISNLFSLWHVRRRVRDGFSQISLAGIQRGYNVG